VEAIRGLAPCVVRLKLSSFYATGAPPAGGRADASGIIDEARLQDALGWIVTAGARPLLCIDRPPNGSLTMRAFANLCGWLAASLARRPGAPHYEIWHEPVFREQFASVEEATDAYCTVAEAIKGASPEAKVGGMGFDAAWEDQLDYFVHHAKPVDFVSLHFYGAHTTSSSDSSLFAAALAGRAADLPRQLSFREVRRLIRDACGGDVELYVTEANVNSALDRDGAPRDPRTRGPFAGAWLAALAASATPYVDKLLWHPLYGEGWGLLDMRDGGTAGGESGATLAEDPQPTFSWLAARAIATYAPRGGSLCRLATDAGGAVLCATQSGVLRSAICIVAADQDPTLRINLAGIDRPGVPRLRVIAPGRAEVRQESLPEGPRQQVQVEGPGIAVIQFIGAP
jgi:hypothetical protein